MNSPSSANSRPSLAGGESGASDFLQVQQRAFQITGCPRTTNALLQTVHRILEDYLPPDPTVARNAIRKLDRAAKRRPA